MQNKPQGTVAIPKKQSLKRVSPGVYRNAGGQLTNQAGRPMPQQPNRQSPPTEWKLQAPPNMQPPQRPMGPALDPGFFSNAATGRQGMADLPDGLLTRLYEIMGSKPEENPPASPIRGVDPRDPNRYWKDPNGNVMGTYIGWKGMEKFNPEWIMSGQTKIPRVNSVVEKIKG
jgi:hypothetical protein